jgi:hypothetical protein
MRSRVVVPASSTRARQEGVGAAQLEGAAALEHLGLEPDAGAELGRGQERCAHGDAAERGGGGAEIGEGDQGHGGNSPRRREARSSFCDRPEAPASEPLG